MKPKLFKGLIEFWLTNFVNDGLCSLCGNSGVIDTRASAVSAAGTRSGRLNWCICPNGMTLRANMGRTPEELGYKTVQEFLDVQERVLIKDLMGLDEPEELIRFKSLARTK